MAILSVFVAALAGWMIGAVWYMSLAKAWMEAASIPVGADGKPEGGQSPALIAFGFAMIFLVAALMAHMFGRASITLWHAGLTTGLAVGAFFITPWIALNNSYCGRPAKLTLIDGGYAILACGVMGLILTLF